MSQSTRLTSAMRYESATNELPLSSIKFSRYPDSPDIDNLNKRTFEHHYHNDLRNEISLMATNERPLSCTCLPKLLTDNCNLLNTSQNSINSPTLDAEFIFPEIVLSSSCPLPHGNFLPNENQIYSADFQERLNDYNAYREHKKSVTPRIFINDSIPTMSDFKSMRKASITTEKIDSNDCNLKNPAYQTNLNSPISARATNLLQFPMHSVLKKPIVKSSPQLSSDPSASNANSRTKQSIISTSSNSTTSNIVTNVNNTTIPHPNIVKIHNSDATQTTQTSTTRRQRHSIAGQMGFFKIMDIAGGFSRKMATSTNSLFSTAVISGSSSAPNLHQINTASPSGTNYIILLIFFFLNSINSFIC